MKIHYRLTLASGEHYEGTCNRFGHPDDAPNMVLRDHVDLSSRYELTDFEITVEEIPIDLDPAFVFKGRSRSPRPGASEGEH